MLTRLNRAWRLLLRTPSAGAASLVYSAAIHASSMHADILDLGNPWWIVTAAIVLLFSPLFHAFIIQRTFASIQGIPFRLRDLPAESFGSLVAGEILVNVAVVLGSVFFLLPGVYAGLRLIYYKQAVVLHKARISSAVRESLLLTADGRRLVKTFVVLAVSYCVPVGIDLLALPAADALWVHVVAVAISTLFIAWINVYLTLAFVEDAQTDENGESAGAS